MNDRRVTAFGYQQGDPRGCLSCVSETSSAPPARPLKNPSAAEATNQCHGHADGNHSKPPGLSFSCCDFPLPSTLYICARRSIISLKTSTISTGAKSFLSTKILLIIYCISCPALPLVMLCMDGNFSSINFSYA